MLCALILSIFSTTLAGAQNLSTQVNPELGVPVGDSSSIWGLGGGAESIWSLSLPSGIPFVSDLSPLVTAAYRVYPNDSRKSLGLASGGLGIAYESYFSDHWGAGAEVATGLYQGSYDGLTASNLFWQAGASVKYRFSPALELGLGTSWQNFLGPHDSLLQTLGLRLNLGISWDGFQEAGRLEVGKVDLKPVYPVLYSQYDKESMGTVSFTNREVGEIHNLKVSFFAKQFMERPKVSIVVPSVPRGGVVEAPLYALFTSEVLKLIESTKVLAEISVEYEIMGSLRRQTFESPLKVYNRNAMSWDDDKKASAFVSGKDPAVLRYSKYVSGIIRNQPLQGFGTSLKYGIGLFECLKLMGINYVVDPTTPYTEFSTNASAVDFLQFPYQTLTYKGGDCDDLSILFTSVLQSVGIRTAFITVPGHIYAAFSLDLGQKEASALFADLDNLILVEGTYWVPVEITMLGADFAKAWNYGAQEWKEAGDKARLYPMEASWKQYDPVSPPDQDTRVTLPSNKEIEDQLALGLARFTEANLPAKLASLKRDLTAALAADKGKVWNKMGILYAKYGRFSESKDAFLSAGKVGFTLADTNLGNLALIQKDYPTAQSRFEKSQRANPTDFSTILGLAMTYYETERYTDAAVQYNKLVALDPPRAANYQYLSRAQGASR